MEYGVKKLVRIKKKKAVRIRERKRVVRRNEECGADSHKMWWGGGGLHYLLYITIVLQVPQRMQKIYSMAPVRKPTAMTRNMLPTFSPVNCSSFVAVEKKSFYKKQVV